MDAEAAGLRRRRRVHEELGGRRHRGILHVARRPGRRGGGRRRAGHRDRGGQLRHGIPRPRVRALPARVPRRTHAESGRAVQQRDQVQRVSRPCARAGRRPYRDRPLCAPAAGGGRPRPGRVVQGCGRDQGPELLPAPADPAAAGARAVSAGRHRQARGSRARPARRHPDLGEEGLHRHLFHRRAAVSRLSRALPAARARTDAHPRRRRGRPA